MIKKILITNLGRFKNFKFDDVDDFKRFNVLYGWNYSGKTTLSRAFMVFDNKKTPEHYDGVDFTLERTNGNNLNPNVENDRNSLRTKVFNSDYVEENLFFKDTGASNILVLADNAQEIMTKIEQLKTELQFSMKSKTEFQKQQTENQTYLENRRSQEARRIKENLHGTFTASTFLSYERKLKDENSIETYIIENDDELCKKRRIAISEKNKELIASIPLLPIIDIVKLKELLNETVNITKPLTRLSNNKEAEKWVREGLALHNDANTCFYCGRLLDENIINELNAHFDKSYNDFIAKIELQQNNIKPITSFNDILPDTTKFYEQFENKYLKEKECLEVLRKEYNDVIKQIQQLLCNKLKSVTQPISFDIDYDFTKINAQIQRINNGVIKEHNAFNSDFDKQKGEALEELRMHYVAEIITGKDYTNAERAINEAIIGIKKITEEIDEKEKEKKSLEAKISESVAGAEKVNAILKRLFMGKTEIELVQKSSTETEKYILVRNDKPAHYLSEGEKTAISFAHFLASLESKDLADKLGETILYIDDPISSLDNNHIYAIFAEIDRLRKEENPNIVGDDKRKFKQLFVSTHNYHLFRLLTERDEKYIGIYYIKRNRGDSVIENFSKNILQQKAEYTFLFNQIKKYIDGSNEDDYIIGHFLRRFLEIFATYKNPTKCELRTRIQQIVDLKVEYKANETLLQAVYKTVNEESHTYITNEVINNGSIKNTAEAVLEFVKMVDPDQYSFLEKNYNS
ncbi:MAG: AAA family ATPase [Candidatus Gastranaerophilales bacterium]|nr:AAA family ATPase [Candidatus Gastranaerophilales bacterium]